MLISELIEKAHAESPAAFEESLAHFVLVGQVDSEGPEERDAWSYSTKYATPSSMISGENFRQSQVFPLKKKKAIVHFFADTVLVGRSSRNDIVIEASSISKLHARIKLHAEQATISDAGSSNGTRVNGERLVGNTAAPIQNGDVVVMGDVSLRVFAVQRLYKVLRLMIPYSEGHVRGGG